MPQETTRPVQWADALKRSADAKNELMIMREKLLEIFHDMEDEWNKNRRVFNGALDELIHLQADYAASSVPPNLSTSRTAEKQNDVANLNFSGMLNKVIDLQIFIDQLQRFNPEDDVEFMVLDEAKAVAPPKFYGRD